MTFQSPRGDFGFLKVPPRRHDADAQDVGFQSPRGDFGFLKSSVANSLSASSSVSFNPLAGILVF